MHDEPQLRPARGRSAPDGADPSGADRGARWGAPRWPAGLAAVLLTVVALAGVAVAWRLGAPAIRDFAQLDEPLARLSAGEWGSVYRTSQFVTSPPVYLYLLGVGSVVLTPVMGDGGGVACTEQTLAALRCHGTGVPIGMAMVIACVAAVVWALVQLGVSVRSRGALAGAGAVAVNLAVLACVSEYWHPQDLAAAAAAIVGLGATSRRRPVLAGVAFGVALATRQTAVLIALVALVAFLPTRDTQPDAPDCDTPPTSRRRARWRPAVLATTTTAAVALAACAPFLLTSPGAFVRQLGAQAMYRSPGTLAGQLPASFSWALARTGPVLVAVALAVLLAVQARRAPIGDRALWGAAIVAAAVRVLAEPAPYTYYLAPAVLAAIVLESTRGFAVWATLLGVGGLLVSQAEWTNWTRSGNSVLPASMVGPGWFALGAGLVVLGAHAWWRATRVGLHAGEPSAETSAETSDETSGTAGTTSTPDR